MSKVTLCDNCGVDCTADGIQLVPNVSRTAGGAPASPGVAVPAVPFVADLCPDCHDGIKDSVGKLPFGNRAASGDVVIKSRAKKPKA